MKPVHLLIEEGPETGREIAVPEAGARVGRSSKNDIVLADPSLSRFHCRVAFKGSDQLWVTDLGSSNHTMVNDKEIIDRQVRPGDRIRIGDTTAKVVSDHLDGTVVPPAATPATAGADGAKTSGGEIELGLKGRDEHGLHRPSSPSTSGGRGLLWGSMVAVIVIMVAGAIWLGKEPAPPPEEDTGPVFVEEPDTFSIRYEKVHATPDNIFRYDLSLDPEARLAIRIDDIANSQHIPKEKTLEMAAVRSLKRSIESAGFFDLPPTFSGMQSGRYDVMDLTVTVGHRTHRCVVRNRQVEPDDFRTIREMIEEFGRNQLGLHAVELPREKLLELGQEATLRGQKMYRERNISVGNLARAIQEFSDAEWYLESIEPKPEFYSDAVQGKRDAEEALGILFDERMFIANKAIRNRNWDSAIEELTIVTEMFPDRGDRRYKAAYNKLVDVQRNKGS